jgi:GNAT superfamily N-acetyltransferase
MPDAVADFPFEVRPCSTADEEAVLELLALTVGETSSSRKTIEFWRWKHARNPAGESFSVGAFDGATGRLAGLRTLMWWDFTTADGRALRAARPVDTATHPDYQRRGIFSGLTRYAVDELRQGGIPFIFNTPNENSLPGYLKMGWSIVARLPVYMRPIRPARMLLGLARRRGRAGTRRRDDGARSGAGVFEWSEFRRCYGDRIAPLVRHSEETRPRLGLRTTRDLEYLEWRYGQQPNTRYEVYALGNGDLSGFAIARTATGFGGLRSLVVNEIFVRDPGPGSVKTVLKSVIRRTSADYAIAFFGEGSAEKAALRRLGFLPVSRSGYTLAARVLTAGEVDPLRPDSWDLTLGELELF